jgi:NAD(P)-dependent dehydrogenase (short-subunit alcohol dehydrogenase family)
MDRDRGMDLSGPATVPHARCAVVTGAGSGVGQATALALLAAGWGVALIGRRETALRDTASRAESGSGPAQTLICPCDIADPEAVRRTAERVHRELGPVEVLVNAAGTNTKRRSLEVLSMDDYHLLMGTNLHGAFHCCQAFLPGMRERRFGTIVNIVSDAGKQAAPKAGAAYVMSKFGLAGLTQAINAEERPNGVRACAIFPGDIDTPLLDRSRNSSISSGLVRYASAPGRAQSFHHGLRGVGGDHHDRDRGGARVRAQPSQHLLAGGVGQVQVEQDQVRHVLARQLDADQPLQRGHDAPPRPRQQDRLDQVQVRQVVLDVEQRGRRVRDALQRSRGDGRIFQTLQRIGRDRQLQAEDAPSGPVLSRVSVPPIASVRRCESASPSPVPSTSDCSAPSRAKGVKSWSALSGSMPRPVSSTRSARRCRSPSATVSQLTRTRRPPGCT